ncbi:hypothetical protein ABBQ38_010648 [Trebouxia sp. C0009 RCD-2024]
MDLTQSKALQPALNRSTRAALRPACCSSAVPALRISDKKPPYWTGRTTRVSQAINIAIDNPALWAIMKLGARHEMISTAERAGIPWRKATQELRDNAKLEQLRAEIEDQTLDYPAYYRRKFHAYTGGNLDWQAACELESATASLALRIFKKNKPKPRPDVAADMMRNSFLDTTEDYCKRQGVQIRTAVDVACSAGDSTRRLADRFPEARLAGVDLSPNFLAVAELRRRQAEPGSPAAAMTYVHANAEAIPVQDRSQDLISASYMVHEMPAAATKSFLTDAHRALRPGGVIAIVDGDPWSDVHQKMPLALATIMKSTEPWADEYFSLDMFAAMAEAGFNCLEYVPVNKRHRVMLGVAV